jgi:hypothetical protein
MFYFVKFSIRDYHVAAKRVYTLKVRLTPEQSTKLFFSFVETKGFAGTQMFSCSLDVVDTSSENYNLLIQHYQQDSFGAKNVLMLLMCISHVPSLAAFNALTCCNFVFCQ